MKQPTIALNQESRKLSIQWSDGLLSNYHFIWLRHHARCSDLEASDTTIKLDLLPDNPNDLVIKDYCVDEIVLTIRWNNDDLTTQHDLSDLKEHAYDDVCRQQRKHIPTLWNSTNAHEIPVFNYSDLDDDSILLTLFLAIRDYGVARIKQVPTTPGTIEKVATKLGPIHVNNYGRIFDVQTSTNVSLGSNSGAYLGPHTDENYRHAPPGISLFHCLVASQSGGGDSILVDGYYAAEKLQQSDFDLYQILTKTPVLFQRKALPKEDMRAYGRIISTDLDGQVQGVRFTDRTIPPQDLPDEYVEPVYKALKKFWHIVNAPEQKFQYRMQPGDLHIFDNHRVLHGRTAFDPTQSNRHLQQCSVNRDEFHNTLRTLAFKLRPTEQNLSMAGGALG